VLDRISKVTPITRDLGGQALTPKPVRRLVFFVTVLVLAAALGFAGFMTGLIPWPPDGENGSGLDTIRAQVQDVLATLECATVTPSLSEDRSLFLSGFVSRTEDFQRVRLEMSRIARVTSFKDDLVVHPWPFCQMLILLHGYQDPDLSPAMRTLLETSKPDGRYKEGEYFSVSVTTSKAFDGYLYIDYIDSKGSIVHMLPSPKRNENAVRASQKIVVGARPSEKSEAVYFYKIEPPHGRNMIVAITSRQPLFDIPRPHIESALDYFTALHDALQVVESETSSAEVITAYQFFDTHS
jgi:hypothetical protein